VGNKLGKITSHGGENRSGLAEKKNKGRSEGKRVLKLGRKRNGETGPEGCKKGKRGHLVRKWVEIGGLWEKI